MRRIPHDNRAAAYDACRHDRHNRRGAPLLAGSRRYLAAQLIFVGGMLVLGAIKTPATRPAGTTSATWARSPRPDGVPARRRVAGAATIAFALLGLRPASEPQTDANQSAPGWSRCRFRTRHNERRLLPARLPGRRPGLHDGRGDCLVARKPSRLLRDRGAGDRGSPVRARPADADRRRLAGPCGPDQSRGDVTIWPWPRLPRARVRSPRVGPNAAPSFLSPSVSGRSPGA